MKEEACETDFWFVSHAFYYIMELGEKGEWNMQCERLKVFDENYQHNGEATRAEVHERGLWHETFHCWLVSREAGTRYIYLQLRSETKRDFPGLLDITAAGHLLEGESVEDGVREVEEELGIEVTFDELQSLGVIKDRLVTSDIKDLELTNVFLLPWSGSLDEFRVQKEEVAGIVKAELEQFDQLCSGELESILIEGKDQYGNWIHKKVGQEDIVPHETFYIREVLKRIYESF